MAYELLYTSAPQGLQSGSQGFCMVACTKGLSAPMTAMLESLSSYRRIDPSRLEQESNNPIIFSHLSLQSGEKPIHLLSRIAPAGIDYSQRQNIICHHLALQQSEFATGGPAALCSHENLFISQWNSPPQHWTTQKKIPPVNRKLSPCKQWEMMKGDAGWGGVLAATIENQQPTVLIFNPGMNILPLFDEAIALLPESQRWLATFSTYYTRMPPGITCQWKAVLAGSPEEGQVRAIRNSLVIDLTNTKESIQDKFENHRFKKYIMLARTGMVATAVGIEPIENEGTTTNKTSLSDEATFVSLSPREHTESSFQEETTMERRSLPNSTEQQSTETPIFPSFETRYIPLAKKRKKEMSFPVVLGRILLAFSLFASGFVLGMMFATNTPSDTLPLDTSFPLHSVDVVTKNTASTDTPAINTPNPPEIAPNETVRQPDSKLRTIYSQPLLPKLHTPLSTLPPVLPSLPLESPLLKEPEANLHPPNSDETFQKIFSLLEQIKFSPLAAQKNTRTNKSSTSTAPMIWDDVETAKLCQEFLVVCQKEGYQLKLEASPLLTFSDWSVVSSVTAAVTDTANAKRLEISLQWKSSNHENPEPYLTITIDSKGIVAKPPTNSANFNRFNLFLLTLLKWSIIKEENVCFTTNFWVPLYQPQQQKAVYYQLLFPNEQSEKTPPVKQKEQWETFYKRFFRPDDLGTTGGFPTISAPDVYKYDNRLPSFAQINRDKKFEQLQLNFVCEPKILLMDENDHVLSFEGFDFPVVQNQHGICDVFFKMNEIADIDRIHLLSLELFPIDTPTCFAVDKDSPLGYKYEILTKYNGYLEEDEKYRHALMVVENQIKQQQQYNNKNPNAENTGTFNGAGRVPEKPTEPKKQYQYLNEIVKELLDKKFSKQEQGPEQKQYNDALAKIDSLQGKKIKITYKVYLQEQQDSTKKLCLIEGNR